MKALLPLFLLLSIQANAQTDVRKQLLGFRYAIGEAEPELPIKCPDQSAEDKSWFKYYKSQFDSAKPITDKATLTKKNWNCRLIGKVKTQTNPDAFEDEYYSRKCPMTMETGNKAHWRRSLSSER